MLNTFSVTALVAAFEVSVNKILGSLLATIRVQRLKGILLVFSITKQNKKILISLCHKIRCTGISEQPHLQL